MKKGSQGTLSAAIVLLIALSVLRVITAIDPIGSVLQSVTKPLSETISKLVVDEDVEIAAADPAQQRIQALENEVELLRTSLSVQPEETIQASVIKRDVASIRKHVWVDIGSSDGVKDGDIVLHNGFLFGRIESTKSDQSRVVLLLDPTTAFTASVDRDHGLFVERSGSVVFTSVAASDLEGSLVKTDGLANVLPPGIPIGTLDKNITNPEDVLQTYGVLLQRNPYDALSVQVMVSTQ